jgi:hypothetical protein
LITALTALHGVLYNHEFGAHSLPLGGAGRGFPFTEDEILCNYHKLGMNLQPCINLVLKLDIMFILNTIIITV